MLTFAQKHPLSQITPILTI